MQSLRNENGGLRGLTGSGEPGLFTLLGGTAAETGNTKFTGGAGQVSATSRLAQAYRDVRLAAVASGQAVQAPGANGGASGTGGISGPGGRPPLPGQAR